MGEGNFMARSPSDRTLVSGAEDCCTSASGLCILELKVSTNDVSYMPHDCSLGSSPWKHFSDRLRCRHAVPYPELPGSACGKRGTPR